MSGRKTNPNHYHQTTRHATDGVLADRAGVSDAKEVTPEFLNSLAASASPADRMLAARYFGTAPDTLTMLADDKSPHVRCSAAVNTSATPAILATVTGHEQHTGLLHRVLHRSIRREIFKAVSAHPVTTLDTLAVVRDLAGVRSPAGRYAQERITLAATKERMAARKAAMLVNAGRA